jgi:hypothetical protein
MYAQRSANENAQYEADRKILYADRDYNILSAIYVQMEMHGCESWTGCPMDIALMDAKIEAREKMHAREIVLLGHKLRD